MPTRKLPWYEAVPDLLFSFFGILAGLALVRAALILSLSSWIGVFGALGIFVGVLNGIEFVVYRELYNAGLIKKEQ